jgi:hypothetical protein
VSGPSSTGDALLCMVNKEHWVIVMRTRDTIHFLDLGLKFKQTKDVLLDFLASLWCHGEIGEVNHIIANDINELIFLVCWKQLIKDIDTIIWVSTVVQISQRRPCLLLTHSILVVALPLKIIDLHHLFKDIGVEECLDLSHLRVEFLCKIGITVEVGLMVKNFWNCM